MYNAFMMSSKFGHMLSVGTIQVRFCVSKKRWRWAGIFKIRYALAIGWLPVEWPWPALSGPFLTLLAQMGVETTLLPKC